MARKKLEYRENFLEPEGREEDMRFFESRDIDSRDTNDEIMDYILRNEYVLPTDIDPVSIPPGMHYMWALVDVKGQDFPHRIAELQRRGYSFVPASRHPEKIYRYSFKEDKKYLEDCLYYKGTVLMERPLRYKKAEEEMREKKLRQEMNNIPRTPFMHDPSLGLRVFDYGLERESSYL